MHTEGEGVEEARPPRHGNSQTNENGRPLVSLMAKNTGQ